MSIEIIERLSFGATPQDVAGSSNQKTADWIEQQLHPAQDDPKLNQALSRALLRISYRADTDYPACNENRPLSLLTKSTRELWPLSDNRQKMAYEERIRPLREVTASKLLHARYSQWQIRELMVDFWHNHFNVYGGQPQIAAALPQFDHTIIRANAFGNFRELLQKVAQSTPMLIYLNNSSSRTGAPNENFARELFELHTLGRAHYLNNLYSKWRDVPGAVKGQPEGYIDQDVYEAARAFTGWVVQDGRNVSANQALPNTGEYTYLDSWHDPYQKRVLGQEIEPFAPAKSDGNQVLDMLCAHPATAKHLCLKLCRRFVDDHPPVELVESAATVWRQHIQSPDQVARVLRHIFLSPQFQDGVKSGRYKKLRRPLELAMGFSRKLSLDLAPSQALANELTNAGQKLYLWPTPDGHPDVSSYWLTTQSMRRRWFLPMGILENWWGTGQVTNEQLAQVDQNHASSSAQILEQHASLLLGTSAKAVLARMPVVNPGAPTGRISQANDEWSPLRRSIAYLAMSLEFQWK